MVGSSRKSSAGRVIEADGDVEAAPHPAGVGRDLPVGGVSQVEGRQQLGRTAARRRGRQPVQPTEHHEVLAAEQDLVQGRRLADQTDDGSDLPGLGAHVEAGDRGFSLLDPGQGGERVDSRALAGAVGPEQGVHRSW